MDYKHLLGAGLAFCCAGPLLAQDEIVIEERPAWVSPIEMAAVPDDASGAMFFRIQDSVVRLHPDGQSHYFSQRVKLLDAQALQIGNLAISWNPAAGQAKLHSVKVFRGDEMINILATKTFEILRREENLEQSLLDGMLTAVLQVPDLRVGDELEFAFTLPTHDPTLGGQSFGVMAMANNPPGGRFRQMLSWAEGQKPVFQITEDMRPWLQEKGDSIEIKVDNPDSIAPPRDAPPRYNWMRLAEYSDFTNWQAVSQRFYGLYRDAVALGPDSDVRGEAQRIAAAHSSKRERALAALELVQQQVRYIYVGLNGGNLTPATADEVWERRYGDCKGKTALLLALLNELGIEAEAILASNAGLDDGLTDRLAGPALFDHVLVRARIDGETLWMDGTFPAVAGATTRPLISYRHVLPLTARGSALEELPQTRFAIPQELVLYDIDARAGFSEPARQTVTSAKRGIAGLLEYSQFSAVTPSQLTQAFKSNLSGGDQWDTIENVSYRYDEATNTSILAISGTGPVKWDDKGDGSYGFSLPGGGFNPPPRRSRASDQDQTAPFYSEPEFSCHVTTVRIPDDTAIEDWRFNSTFDTVLFERSYYRNIERNEDGSIRMVRGFRVERPEITPSEATRDNRRIADFDNSMANILYRPDDPWVMGNQPSVPASTDPIWLGPNAPCLSADVLEKR